MKLSIQTRLFGILGLFVVALTLVWGALALVLAYIVEDEIIDRVLSGQVALIQDSYRITGGPPALPLDEVTLYPSLAAAPPELRDRLDPRVRAGEIFTEDATHYHYRWLQVPGNPPLLLLAEVSPWLVVSHASPALLLFVSVGFVLALLLSLAVAYQIARMTTRPLRELTAAIERAPRPDTLPHSDKPDEVGVLSNAMDEALTGLQQALSREKAFTRDISHELRTPLTTLRNALALLPASSRDDPNHAQLVESSREIESLLETLLALARAESSSLKPLLLRPLLERLLLDRASEIEERQFEITLEVPDDARVAANEQVSQLLLGNLLDNALHYADPPALGIRLDGQSLLLENPHAVRSRAPHAASLGHGLSLVHRLARVQSWQCSAGPVGDSFTVRLSW